MASSSVSSITAPAYRWFDPPSGTAAPANRPAASRDVGPDLLALEQAVDVAGLQKVEHHDRDAVVPAEGDRSRVHDLQVLADHVEVGDLVVAGGVGVELRVGAVHAVDPRVGALQDGLG